MRKLDVVAGPVRVPIPMLEGLGDVDLIVPPEEAAAQGIQVPAFKAHPSVCSHCGSRCGDIEVKLEAIHAAVDAHGKRLEDLLMQNLGVHPPRKSSQIMTDKTKQLQFAQIEEADAEDGKDCVKPGVQFATSKEVQQFKSEASGASVTAPDNHIQQEMHRLHTAASKTLTAAPKSPAASTSGSGKRGAKEVSCLQHFVGSRSFEMFVSLNVVANMLIIAVRANIRMQDPGVQETAPVLDMLDIATSSTFALELFLRIASEGWTYLSPNRPDFVWHFFDCFLVLTAVVEGALQIVHGTTGALDLSALRLFKLGRLLRILPAARFHRGMSDMRIIVLSIVHGMRPFFWAGLVLLLVMSIASVVFMELLLALVADDREGYAWKPEIDDAFGTVGLSVYTCIKCILGGTDWGDVAQPLWDASWPIGLVFTSFIAYSQLLLLNVMTGIFVRNAAETANKDEDAMMVYELGERKTWVRQVIKIFNEAAGGDGKGDDILTKDSFVQALSELRVKMLLLKLGIDTDAHSPASLFNLFDYDSSGTLDINEFASALHHFHGYARSVDIAKMKYSIAGIRSQLASIQAHFGVAPTPRQLRNADPDDDDERGSIS